MACYTVSTTTVEFLNANADTFTAALVAAGWQLSRGFTTYFHKDGYAVSLQSGKLSITDYSNRSQAAKDKLATEIKQAYGKQVVIETAKKAGWQVVLDEKNPNKLKIKAGR